MTDWMDVTRRAALASHRLIGWIHWDPAAVANYAALGVPDGVGYYFATRAAPLADAGSDVVTAAYGSINRDFVRMSLELCEQGRGFAAGGVVTEAGVAYRQELEDRLDRICTVAWQALGEDATLPFLDLVEPVGHRSVEAIDATAGPRWMPAARDRRPPPP